MILIYCSIGGKHFSRDLRPLDDNGNEIREKNANDSSSEEEEEDSDEEEEESSEEEEEEKPEMTREQRRAAAKAKKEAAIKKKNQKIVEVGDLPTDSEEESEDDDMPANPNHSKAARNQAKAPPMSVDEVAGDLAKMSVSKRPQELSRKEREAIEAQKKREAYQRLHLAGETDEARADLARLANIREERRVAAERKAVSFTHESVHFAIILISVRPKRKSVRNRSKQSRSNWHGKREEERLLWDLQLEERRERNKREGCRN